MGNQRTCTWRKGGETSRCFVDDAGTPGVPSDDFLVRFAIDGTRTYFLKSTGVFRGEIDPWGNHITVVPGSGTFEFQRVDRREGGPTGTIVESMSFT